MLLVCLALAASSAAGPAFAEAIRAVRATGPIQVDGLLDEEAWRNAPIFDAFVESFPEEGAVPNRGTEVRVVYDDRHIYFGITCFDDQPALIQRQLGRRDSAPSADLVEVTIDSALNRRTAYGFSVNAGGVLRDALFYGDINNTETWDAVWNAEVKILPDGWSVEMALPLSILRFPAAHDQSWGVLVRRTIPRTHQVFASTLISRNANGFVSRFGMLTGLIELKPRADLELTPYTAARATLRPRYSDPARPHPRLLDPSADIGLDFRASLLSDLTLTATLNPDFGQVEADQVIQNLSTFEQFFPEKRPFFNQGLDLFQPVGDEFGAPQRMFYSRRIGLDAPILGAVKITGTLRKGLELGLLDALVLGPVNPVVAPAAYFDSSRSDYYRRLTPYEAVPDRGFRFHPTRPFHFGPTDELPGQRPVTRNFLAAVVRQQVASNSAIGVIATAATPFGTRCSREEFLSEADYQSVDCTAYGGNAAAIDWNLRTADGVYVFLGQLDASQQVHGSPKGRVLRDGTTLKPGDLGLGTYFRGGKLGGEPFRFDLWYQYASPKLNLNATGFQQSQNQQVIGANLHFVRPTGIGELHNFSVDLSANSSFTTDGRWINRANYASIGAYAQLPSYEYIQAFLQWEAPKFDVREISSTGVPFERRPDFALVLIGGTDPNRKLSINGDVFGYRTLPSGPVPVQNGWGLDAAVVWRPTSSLETQLIGSWGEKPQGARYIETRDDGSFVFGAQNPGLLSLTLRQQLVITPRLTLQAYAQLFGQKQHYFAFYQARASNDGRIRLGDLQPITYDTNQDVHSANLNLNVVLRWEYRLGSTFFAVYSRSQQELPTASDAAPSTSVLPSRLFAGAAIDTLLLKWSYWWSL